MLVNWSPIYYVMMGVMFFLGACLGSFLNVVLYRTTKKEDWVRARSKCEKCGRQIVWYENIPLVSWVGLRGKCRTCGQKISLIHPIMELLMGLWFAGIYAVSLLYWALMGGPWNWVLPLFWIGLGVMMILIVVIDGSKKIIPDWLTILILVWVSLFKGVELLTGQLSPTLLLMQLGIGLAVGLLFWGLHLLVWKIYRRDGFGLGDVKLLAVLGFWLGWPRAAVMIFLAFMLGAVGGLIWMAVTGKGRKTAIAFGPFIILAAILAAVWGQSWWHLLFF